MRPGGWDVVVPIPWTVGDGRGGRRGGLADGIGGPLAEIVHALWPNAICETGGGDEVFFYRDRRAQARWDAGVFRPSDDDMLHVIGGPQNTTLVGGRRDGIAAKVAAALLAGRSRP